MTQHQDLDAWQERASAYRNSEISRIDINCDELLALIDRLRKAESAREGWKLMPVEPTREIISAMSCSKARDDEGEFPAMVDLLDFSGENKTHTALKAAYLAAVAAAPDSTPTDSADSEGAKG